MSVKTYQHKEFANNELTQFELSKITLKSLNKFKLSPTSKLVLLTLVDCYPKIFPSQSFIAKQLGIGLTSVKKAVSELKKMGFIMYETKKVNNYAFTSKFFGLIKSDPLKVEKETLNRSKSDYKQIKEKRNKQSTNVQKNPTFSQRSSEPAYLKEYKKRKYYHNNQQTGINYPKWAPEKIEKSSPLDFNKQEALKYLENLPKILENSYFAKELRKNGACNLSLIKNKLFYFRFWRIVF